MGEGDQWQVRKAFQIKGPLKFQEEDGRLDGGLDRNTNEKQNKSTIGV